MDVSQIFGLDSLAELSDFLLNIEDQEALCKYLHSEFMAHVNYTTPQEWNRAVRLCECLAIIGWGESEAVEAHVGKYFNGYPNTFFATADNKVRYLDAVWQQKDGGTAIDRDRSFFNGVQGHEIKAVVCEKVKLNSQRNWIAKPPVMITRTLDNCYPGSRKVVDSLDKELNPLLFKQMPGDRYGSAINRIYIICSMSFYDNEHCKTNYVIADEDLRLRKSDYYPTLLKLYSEAEIEEEGLYLRPRYEIGPLRKDTGKINIKIVLEKEFSTLSEKEQKLRMSEYFVTSIMRIAKRYGKLDYKWELLIEDFRRALELWTENKTLPI